MEMIVLWSDIAIADLQDIHDYFFSKANKKVADKIIGAIVYQTLLLEHNPRIGQTD